MEVTHEDISKAAGLVEALPYIQRFHDKVIVVKVGGSIMDDEQSLSNLLTDIVFMNYVGMQPVVVHGGGKAINDAMEKAGLTPQWVQGRRYTDERTLAIAEHVLCNQVNRFIVDFIQTQGCEAMGLHSLASSVLFAQKTYLSGEGGRRIDLGLVGEVSRVVISKNRRYLFVIGKGGGRLLDTRDGLVLSGTLVPPGAMEGRVEMAECFKHAFVSDTGTIELSCGDKEYRREPGIFNGDARSRLREILADGSGSGSN